LSIGREFFFISVSLHFVTLEIVVDEERHGLTPSGECAVMLKDISATCE
jgi:hypothetical protein